MRSMTSLACDTVRVGALAGIGSTPLVELAKVVPNGVARVLVKLEWANPTGSMKDRMAAAAIVGAEARGELKPGSVVVEYTAGTTGISLAFVCAAKGYGLHIVYSDAFSEEKRLTMLAFGATVEQIPGEREGITEGLIKAMIARAHEVAARPDHWWCDQLNNHDAITGYLPLGEEIWEQSGGTVDAFVQAVGTAHLAARRAGRCAAITAMRRRGRAQESAVLSGGPTGAHKIAASGTVSFRRCGSRTIRSTRSSQVTTKDDRDEPRLAAEEGLLCRHVVEGESSSWAIRVAERLGAEATVATLIKHSGFRHLSTELYRR